MSVLNAVKVAGKALGALALTEKLTEGVMEMTEKPDVQEDDLTTTGPPTIVEEIEVEARNLIRRVQELIREGNVRTLRIKDKNGKYLLEIPLTVGVVAGGAFALAAPWAVALSALAGFLVDVKIEIVREVDDGEDNEPTGDE
jgi:hypothetical protein